MKKKTTTTTYKREMISAQNAISKRRGANQIDLHPKKKKKINWFYYSRARAYVFVLQKKTTTTKKRNTETGWAQNTMSRFALSAYLTMNRRRLSCDEEEKEEKEKKNAIQISYLRLRADAFGEFSFWSGLLNDVWFALVWFRLIRRLSFSRHNGDKRIYIRLQANINSQLKVEIVAYVHTWAIFCCCCFVVLREPELDIYIFKIALIIFMSTHCRKLDIRDLLLDLIRM